VPAAAVPLLLTAADAQRVVVLGSSVAGSSASAPRVIRILLAPRSLIVGATDCAPASAPPMLTAKSMLKASLIGVNGEEPMSPSLSGISLVRLLSIAVTAHASAVRMAARIASGF
jgi:hypothetical protein